MINSFTHGILTGLLVLYPITHAHYYTAGLIFLLMGAHFVYLLKTNQIDY